MEERTEEIAKALGIIGKPTMMEEKSLDVTGMTDHVIQEKMYYILSNKMKELGFDLKKETSAGNMSISYGKNYVFAYHINNGIKTKIVTFKFETVIEQHPKNGEGFLCTASAKLTWN